MAFEQTLLQKIQKEFQANRLRPRSQQARSWFEMRLKNISNINRNRILKDPMFTISKRPAMGAMMMYFYEAKNAETLPYWDRFPLTLMVSPTDNGFYGLNLHYISPPLRALLLSRLYSVASNKRYDETTKLSLSYDILKGSQRYRQYAPCFKRYLYEQVRSPYSIVHASEWELAIFLPSESFLGATKQQVWKESSSII